MFLSVHPVLFTCAHSNDFQYLLLVRFLALVSHFIPCIVPDLNFGFCCTLISCVATSYFGEFTLLGCFWIDGFWSIPLTFNKAHLLLLILFASLCVLALGSTALFTKLDP